VRPGRVDLAAATLLCSRTSRCRTRVSIRFANCTRWNGSTLILAFGSWVADGSIATTWIRARHVGLRPASQPLTAAESRPSTIPNT
jgi:hypothetical protein